MKVKLPFNKRQENTHLHFKIRKQIYSEWRLRGINCQNFIFHMAYLNETFSSYVSSKLYSNS